MITRESPLALWQTTAVTTKLQEAGHRCEVLPVKSTGDIDLINPIYEIGVQGVFTRELDAALLNNQADAAVHSLKDIPTVLAEGLQIAAVMERGPVEDILFVKPGFIPDATLPGTIATSSIRRKAQWLERYPRHVIVNVRGNVETRLEKFRGSQWDGIIMAKAGVYRLGIDLTDARHLAWMLPSPAQGAIAVVCRKTDPEMKEIFAGIHHQQTHQCVTAERDFLRHLHGGCSVPISAYAWIENNNLLFTGAVHRMDGTENSRVTKTFDAGQWSEAGRIAAEEILAHPAGQAIVEEIRHPRQ